MKSLVNFSAERGTLPNRRLTEASSDEDTRVSMSTLLLLAITCYASVCDQDNDRVILETTEASTLVQFNLFLLIYLIKV